jgi:hypothetical protein
LRCREAVVLHVPGTVVLPFNLLSWT